MQPSRQPEPEQWTREPGFDIGTFGKTPKTKNLSIVRGNRYHNSIYKLLGLWQPTHAPHWDLLVEPWLRSLLTRRMLQPDFVLLDAMTNTAIVGEVKLNWKDGRDVKLLDEYLYAVQSAYGLEATWPALVTKNVAHLAPDRKPRLGLGSLLSVDDWKPGDPCPVILVP